MTFYDLLFIAMFLASLAALIFSAFAWRRRVRNQILLSLAFVWTVYSVILVASDLAASPRIARLGEDQCFDEMCFAVTQVQIPAANQSLSIALANNLYVVTMRVTSRSRGRTQSEGGLRARLYDGSSFFPVSDAAQREWELRHGPSAKLTARLAPGETILSTLVFEVPITAAAPDLALDHGFTPGYFIIGESPFFHPPDVLRLRPTP